MSSPGWPKGKPRGPYSPERMGKVRAGALKKRRTKSLRQASLASGIEMGGVGPQYSQHSAGSINITAAAFRSAHTHVGDYEFVDDSLDECLLRALHERVVYAGRPDTHHEPPFQDVTIAAIAAVERHHMKMSRNGRDPRKPSLPLPEKMTIERRPIAPRELEIITLLATGLTLADIGVKLGIKRRSVRARCDVLRIKLGVKSVREIPFAYKRRTGEDPFPVTSPPVTREGSSLTAVVEEMFAARSGKPLTAVVSELFDS